MITAFSFFKLSYPEGQLEWVRSPQTAAESLCLCLPLHCGSVNCSYSNIPSLPSPQLSYSQPLSCSIINLLVLSTCKSQTIEPYGVILGCAVIRSGGITEPPSFFRSPKDCSSPPCLLPVSSVSPPCLLCVSYMSPPCLLRVSYVFPTCLLRVSVLVSGERIQEFNSKINLLHTFTHNSFVLIYHKHWHKCTKWIYLRCEVVFNIK